MQAPCITLHWHTMTDWNIYVQINKTFAGHFNFPATTTSSSTIIPFKSRAFSHARVAVLSLLSSPQKAFKKEMWGESYGRCKQSQVFGRKSSSYCYQVPQTKVLMAAPRLKIHSCLSLFCLLRGSMLVNSFRHPPSVNFFTRRKFHWNECAEISNKFCFANRECFDDTVLGFGGKNGKHVRKLWKIMSSFAERPFC